jgi:hypothetical protein
MKRKHIVIAVYIGIAVLFGLYQWKFGDNGYRGLAYNLGRGLVWPFALFPSLGNFVGAIILTIFVAVALMT